MHRPFRHRPFKHRYTYVAVSVGLPLALVAALGFGWTHPGSAAAGDQGNGVATPQDDPGRGLVYAGLKAQKVNAPGLAQAWGPGRIGTGFGAKAPGWVLAGGFVVVGVGVVAGCWGWG